MKRALMAVAVAGSLACASSQPQSPSTRVRLITSPGEARVSLDCSGGRKIDAAAPVDFDFPNGPDARCIADLSAAHYRPALVYIDRQYLIDNGEFPNRGDLAPGPHVNPATPVTGPGAVVGLIAAGIEHLVNAAHRAAAAGGPDVTLRIALKPESPS